MICRSVCVTIQPIVFEDDFDVHPGFSEIDRFQQEVGVAARSFRPAAGVARTTIVCGEGSVEVPPNPSICSPR
jgi:hypothetical protein